VDEERWGSLRPKRREPTRPFLKWAGGKAQALNGLREHIPDLAPGGTYFEPFLGGGAVFFDLAPASAVLSDLNEGLILTFMAVKNHVSETTRALSRLPDRPTERQYYDLRKRFNRLLQSAGGLVGSYRIEFAALFVWLNHTCYNGLFRVNRKGEFNVPFGFYQKPAIFTEAGLKAASRLLNKSHAQLVSEDFEQVLADAGKGDLAYLDPPYDPLNGTSSFTTYTARGFTVDDQARLARVVRDAVARGCRVILSNSPSPMVKRLYEGFRFESVLVPRAINCDGGKRTAVDELVVIA
jgi:DNA adenine methylase